MEIEKHKVRNIVVGLQKTLKMKVSEFREQCPDQSRMVAEQSETLQKRLGKILDEESWNQTKLLEMSTITFLMAVAAEGLTQEKEDSDDGEAFAW